MRTIFLVEDEIIELNLLLNHIDWTGMGLRVVGTARNGKKAWEQIQQLQPDIVLTDVRMPFMDGLQLASLIQERFAGMKIVFLSGHDEFTYVKTALHAGAAGYLLKPVNMDELHGVMTRVKDDLEKLNLLKRSKHVLIAKQIEELYRSQSSSGQTQAWEMLIQMEPQFCSDHYVTALIHIGHDVTDPLGAGHAAIDDNDLQQAIHTLLELNELTGIDFKLTEQERLLAVKADPGADMELFWRALSESLKRKVHPRTVTIGIAETTTLLQYAPLMLEEAKKAADERFYTGDGRIIRSIQVPEETENESDSELEVWLQPGKSDTSDRSEAIEQCFQALTKIRASKAHVYEAAVMRLREIWNEYAKYEDKGEAGFGEFDDWKQRLLELDTIDAIKRYIQELALKLDQYAQSKQQDRHMMLVQEIAQFIDESYAQPLTIEYLAGKVYLSPNYLRALFREKKGCTIHDYLTKVRLTKAIELLHDRTLKIHDVARKVGYDNTSYFCSFFYKSQGVTPNEYRKKFL